MEASKSQEDHQTNLHSAKDKWEDRKDPDQRAEEEDMQLKISSTRQWLKLFKERIEKFSLLLIEEDKSNLPQTSPHKS